MIKYNLICECGKTFESWFSSSDGYETLWRKKFINCIYCNSTLVKKTVMAPNLYGKTNKISKNTKLEKKIKTQLLSLENILKKIARMLVTTFRRKSEVFIMIRKLLKVFTVGLHQKKPPSYWRKV